MDGVKIFGGLLLLLTEIYFGSAQVSSGTILDVLTRTNGLKTFGSWCQETYPGLYSGTGVLTVFAFNDTSYTYQTPSALRDKLRSLSLDQKQEYVHTYTLESRISVDQMRDSSEVKSLNGKKLFINKRNRVYWNPGGTTGSTATYINGAMIIREQLQASNGIIHVLDRPLDLVSDKNVYQWLKRPDDPTISTTKWMDIVNRLNQGPYSQYFIEAVTPLTRSDKVTLFIPNEQILLETPTDSGRLEGKQLADYFKMHYILDKVVYTSYVEHQESYQSGNTQERIMFMRQSGNKVLVKCGGVTASVVRGNITVSNGVIHIIDRIFGYVYYSAKEQIAKDANQFNQLLDNVRDTVLTGELYSNGMTLFVPTDEAFSYVPEFRSGNWMSNLTLVEFVARLCSVRDGSVEVSQLNGNYDVRQRRYTRYSNWKLVIYNDRNESWVNAGHVRAKIVKPDVKVTNGYLQYIDGVPGVPSMDIPTLIYYDDYLIVTYNDLKRVGLDLYLRDQSFDSSLLPPRSFDQNGYGTNNFGQPNIYMYTTMRPNEYPTQYPGQSTQYPNNIPEFEYQRRLQQAQQSGQYPNNQYPNNQYPNNQYPNNQYPNNQYPNNQYPNNQYPNNQYPNNQYPTNNQYPNNQYGSQTSGDSYYGPCGSTINPCQFTAFVPNGTAIYNYYMTSLGTMVTRDVQRYRYVLRRHIIPNEVIFIEEMQVSSQSRRLRAHNGDEIILRKESENTVRISWSGVSARVIMSDLGATNGVVHIIDNVLSQLSDQTVDVSGKNKTQDNDLSELSDEDIDVSGSTTLSGVDVSGSTILSGNFCVLGLIALLLCFFHGQRG